MTDFILKQLPYDLSNQASLALIGKYLKHVDIKRLVEPAFPVRCGAPNSDILKMAPCGYMPLDVDTFAFANSGTAKEHVGRTYAGVDGYCPLATYLGTQGFCLELALRPGTQHSVSQTECNIERVLPMAARLTASRSAGGDTAIPLLFRAGSGFDSAKLMCAIGKQALALKREIAFIIKWNPRTTPVETVAKNKTSDASTPWTPLRAGKRKCLWADRVQLRHGDDVLAARRVYRLTERTMDKRGQQMLLPEYVLEGWRTTLPTAFTPEQIIALYADHGTHEQFHSEFRTDMSLVRLPSGTFDTNHLVCALAAVAMNLLRLVGQHTLHEPDAPVRHSAQRRRIRTVMQELMFKAARMVHHARQWVLGLGANDTAFAVFERHWAELDTA